MTKEGKWRDHVLCHSPPRTPTPPSFFYTAFLPPLYRISQVMKRSHQSHTRPSSPQEQQGTRVLSSLHASVSPPRKRSTPAKHPHLAAIEAGQVQVTDHPAIISSRLTQCIRSFLPGSPRLDVAAWLDLYRRNLHPKGRHFVVHQHDHPIAGVHYDLRLQFSETSSVSWSIMYGLPGDPNTRRLNRNATETRVHCLWVCF